MLLHCQNPWPATVFEQCVNLYFCFLVLLGIQPFAALGENLICFPAYSRGTQTQWEKLTKANIFPCKFSPSSFNWGPSGISLIISHWISSLLFQMFSLSRISKPSTHLLPCQGIELLMWALLASLMVSENILPSILFFSLCSFFNPLNDSFKHHHLINNNSKSYHFFMFIIRR